MPRILFIASHRKGRAPGQRFRFEQYMDHLEGQGFQCELSALVTPEDDAVIYRKGHYYEKARFVRKCMAIREKDLRRIKDFDIVFVFREGQMTRSTRFERKAKEAGARMVFDFDDSIWLDNVSEANRQWAWIKGAGKTSRIIGLSDLVFAGNAYLSRYAQQFNSNVQIIPTTIDTELYKPAAAKPDGPVCIGWSGSITTIQHFQYAVPALRAIREHYGDRVSFRVVGDGRFVSEELGVQGIPWRADTEIEDLQAMDIGIMPLPDDEWAKGKCGLKGLQYMGLGIPAIMSPVGVNSEIIAEGENGYLAATTEEWIAKLSKLIDDAELRRRMGSKARSTVEERFSVKAWKGTYVDRFQRLLAEQKN